MRFKCRINQLNVRPYSAVSFIYLKSSYSASSANCHFQSSQGWPAWEAPLGGKGIAQPKSGGTPGCQGGTVCLCPWHGRYVFFLYRNWFPKAQLSVVYSLHCVQSVHFLCLACAAYWFAVNQCTILVQASIYTIHTLYFALCTDFSIPSLFLCFSSSP